MNAKARIDRQPAYVLHSYPYSETSLIVEVFSRDHGRLPLLARGARRPRAALRGVLQSFQPLELGWFGGGELRTLANAEWQGGLPLLSGKALLLGFYLNELLLKLLPRDDAHQRLFECYTATLRQMSLLGRQEAAAFEAVQVILEKEPASIGSSADMPDSPLDGANSLAVGLAAALRQFEKNLLQELGYGLHLERDARSGVTLDPARRYCYQLELGPVLIDDMEPSWPADAAIVHGKTLMDVALDNYKDVRTRLESRQLMRQLLQHVLGSQQLQTRRIFFELQKS